MTDEERSGEGRASGRDGGVRTAALIPGLGLTHHTHLVCIGCGRLEEFVSQDVQDYSVGVAEDSGFEVSFTCFEVFGLCKGCESP